MSGERIKGIRLTFGEMNKLLEDMK